MPQWFKRTVLAVGCLSSSLLSLEHTCLRAKQDAMTEIYGQGVHRYFAGDYAGAELLLNQVLGGGSEIPESIISSDFAK